MRSFSLVLAALFSLCAFSVAAPRQGVPNVLIILADDLGYSDLGCYGGEIETPHLDALAKNGLRFSQFYNTARCWPTRASMMTGYYAQQVNRDKIAGRKFGGNRGGRPSWAKLLPELLKPAGYRSYHSGKWHIDGKPMQTGFDRSYDVSNHGFFRLKFHFLDGVKQGPTEVSDDFYVTDAIADHAVEILREHEKKHAESPFMHFLAFTAPHFPLHAKPADVERYRKRYRAGWDEMRTKRHARQKELGFGFGELSEVESKVGPPYDFPDAYKILGEGEVKYPDPWDGLTDVQKNFQADKMAAHAAMVDSMDQGIGRVLDQIRKMGEWEDTLVLFLSDNGASAEIMVRGDGHDPKAPWASAYTYLCLGPGWSTVSNTPFRMHKTWVHEGGACTPLVAHWPRGIQGKGRISDRVGHVIDLVPTVLELAGLPAEKKTGPAYPGTSLNPVFNGKGKAEVRDLWWAHDGHRAYRSGDWKIVSKKGKDWELYDMGDDRTERKDLAASKKAKVKQLAQRWEKTVDGFIRDLKK